MSTGKRLVAKYEMGQLQSKYRANERLMCHLENRYQKILSLTKMSTLKK